LTGWIDKWVKRIKLNRISKIVIPVALVLLVLFAAFTYYGTQVGNFVVNVDNDDALISVSMTDDLSDTTTRLSVPALDGQNLATLTDIPSDIERGIGVKSDYEGYTYFAVSFYLINVSDRSVDYDVSMKIIDNVGVGRDIVRIMLIEGDNDGVVYAEAEDSDEAASLLKEQCGYETVDFVSDSIVFAHHVNDLYAGVKIKYTVVLWMEGWDELAVDGCEGSRVKMQMDFVAY